MREKQTATLAVRSLLAMHSMMFMMAAAGARKQYLVVQRRYLKPHGRKQCSDMMQYNAYMCVLGKTDMCGKGGSTSGVEDPKEIRRTNPVRESQVRRYSFWDLSPVADLCSSQIGMIYVGSGQKKKTNLRRDACLASANSPRLCGVGKHQVLT